MNSKLRKIFHLSLSEFFLLLIASICAPSVVITLKIFGLRWTRSALSAFSLNLFPTVKRNIGDNTDVINISKRIARVVGIGARYSPVPVICLPRSLMLWWLLKWRGVESDLCIGIDKESVSFHAHAWVEVAGVVVNDRADIRASFAAFNPHPSINA